MRRRRHCGLGNQQGNRCAGRRHWNRCGPCRRLRAEGNHDCPWQRVRVQSAIGKLLASVPQSSIRHRTRHSQQSQNGIGISGALLSLDTNWGRAGVCNPGKRAEFVCATVGQPIRPNQRISPRTPGLRSVSPNRIFRHAEEITRTRRTSGSGCATSRRISAEFAPVAQ